MLVDMFSFVFILAIIIVAYGVATFSLKYPNTKDDKDGYHTVIDGTILKPYWQVYGEMTFLEEPSLDDEKCFTDQNKIEEGEQRCPRNELFNTPLWIEYAGAIYMILANVLLLNLLIALFASSYTKIEERSDELWKYQRSILVVEYRDKYILPAPFSIFFELYYLFGRLNSALKKYICMRKDAKFYDWGGEALDNFVCKKVRDDEYQQLVVLERIAAEDVVEKCEMMENEITKSDRVEKDVADLKHEIKLLNEALRNKS